MFSSGKLKVLIGGVLMGLVAGASPGPATGTPPLATTSRRSPPALAAPAPRQPPFASIGRMAGAGLTGLTSWVAGADETPIVPPPIAVASPATDPALLPPPPEPAPVVELPIPPTTPVAGGATWAVVIGIDDYPGRASDLKSAVNDADDMVAALAVLGVPPERRLVLRNRDATAGTIRAAADWLVERAGPDSSAAFFYSGHVRKLGPATEAFVGSDGAVVPDVELAERLAGLAARQVWVAVAGCYGAGFTELLAPGRILTGAAPANALAFESSLYGRSYLVQFMIREAILEGRAPGSVQAAFAYANRQLALRHPGRQLVQLDRLGTALDLRTVASAVIPLPPSVLAPVPVAPPAPPLPPAPTAPPPVNCLLLILCSPS